MSCCRLSYWTSIDDGNGKVVKCGTNWGSKIPFGTAQVSTAPVHFRVLGFRAARQPVIIRPRTDQRVCKAVERANSLRVYTCQDTMDMLSNGFTQPTPQVFHLPSRQILMVGSRPKLCAKLCGRQFPPQGSCSDVANWMPKT